MMDYYGDTTRWFLGTIVDISDPIEMGRVRVRIYGIHSNNIEHIPTADLPWAQVMADVNQGGVSGIGANVGLKEGAQVFGIFLDGKNSQVPLVMGSISKLELTPESEKKKQIQDPSEIPNPKTEYEERNFEISGTAVRAKALALDLDATLEGTTNEEKAYLFLRSKRGGSFSPQTTAGIVGNLIVESGMDPTIVSGVKGEDSQGIAQWNPSRGAGYRLQNLKRFAALNNMNPLTLTPQLMFIKYELEQNPSWYEYANLRAAKTVAVATDIFGRKYENPKDLSASIDKRTAAANRIFNTFKNPKA